MDNFINFIGNKVPAQSISTDKWKILIVDDEQDIHKITKLVLKPLIYDNRSVEFFSAYSAVEAFSVLEKEPQIAIVLLDVVMETDDAGLVLVKRIREELKNSKVRIILRTGQPGQAPEKSVISKYDINDYKEKTELTTTKLFTSVISSLRSYRDIKTLDDQKKIIEEKSFLNQFILNSMPCKTLLINEEGTAISCTHFNDDKGDKNWICVKSDGKCTEHCNWLNMNIPLSSSEQKRWEYKTGNKTYEVCYFPTENDIRLVYAFDISERVRVEMERSSFEAQLVQSQKMEAVGLLASGIVHDFNNYLTAISGFAQMINSGRGVKTGKNYATRIVSTVGKASKLVSRLLTFSRIGKGEMQPIRISTLLEDCIELLKPKCKLVKIKLLDSTSNLYVYGDLNTIQNSLLNLGINSIDAMPQGGNLIYKLDVFSDNDFGGLYLTVEVTDDGIGISDDIKKRVFEPFFTTKEEGKGTGLGLAGAYGCIRKHNGIISLESSLGEGTTFKILLPILRHSNINSPINMACSIPERETKASVVLCTNDSITIDTLKPLIESLGHIVDLYPLDSSTMDRISKGSNKGDLLIIDIEDMQEPEQSLVINSLQKDYIKPILFLSDRDKYIVPLDGAENKVFLRKPFDYHQFYNSFAGALDLGINKNTKG